MTSLIAVVAFSIFGVIFLVSYLFGNDSSDLTHGLLLLVLVNQYARKTREGRTNEQLARPIR